MVRFLAEATEAGGLDCFTPAGREMVESFGQSLRSRPTNWLLLLVQVANAWQAARIAISYPPGYIRVEMAEVGDRRDWLEPFVLLLQSGELSPSYHIALLQKALWSGLAHTQGSVTLVCSAAQEGESAKAVRLGLDHAQWGGASLETNSFVLQFSLQDPPKLMSDFAGTLNDDLHKFVCSDTTVVTCDREVTSFVPISPRGPAENTAEADLALGLWAFSAPSGDNSGIPLGRSFAKLDSQGIARRELTFGTFRTGLLGESSLNKSRARAVIVFTHHLKAQPSRMVWLSDGVEVAHHSLELPIQELAVTIYSELPKDVTWDLGQQCFHWETRLEAQLQMAMKDLVPAFQVMVEEYNSYTPAVESSTLGCWSLLALCSVGLAGLSAPFFGTQLALGFGLITALALMHAEYRFRFRKRYLIGEGLKQLAEVLENDGETQVWKKERMFCSGEPYPETQ